jgi:vacuolar protein sorting-associated protein 13A/C
MFEALLEKLLERILGEYVEGISKDQMKVGIWSGNVDISYLRLKSSILAQLNLPFELKFGMIENLKMKIPWKSLSTASVEVQLRGLYFLITPKHKSTWKDLEFDLVKNKQEALLTYAKNITDLMTEKLKQQGKEAGEKGYFGKLIEKIVDNLQISIQDIHLRIESVTEPVESLSFGITLDNLNVYTCDELWKRTFLDRSENQTASNVAYKLLNMENFYIYWNAEETVFLSEKCQTKDEYFIMLKSLIYNEANKNSPDVKRIHYLLNFSTTAKLKQTKLSQASVATLQPEYDVDIQLDSCNFNISQAQVKQTSKIINLVNDFVNFSKAQQDVYQNYQFRPNGRIIYCDEGPEKGQLIKEWWRYALRSVRRKIDREKSRVRWIVISPKLKRQEKLEFLALFRRILISKNPDPFEELNENEKLRWANALMTSSESELKKWIEDEMKKDTIQEAIKKKQNQKTGFMGLWGKQKEVSKEEENEMQKFIDDMLKQEDNTIEVPNHYPRFKIRFTQRRFNILMTKKELVDSLKEEIKLQTKDLQIDVFIKKDGIKCLALLKSIKLNYERKDLMNNVLYNQELFYCEKAGESFFTLKLEDKPPEIPGLDKLIDVSMGSIHFIYNPQLIKALTDIFKFEISSEATEKIRLNTQKKIREAKDIGETALKNFVAEQPKLKLDINVKTPQIVLPLEVDRIQNSPCWIFYPGNLAIRGDTFRGGDNTEMYDKLTLSLTDIQFVFCRNTQFVLSKAYSIEQMRGIERDEFFYLFRDFNIDIEIKTLKQVFITLNVIDTRTIVEAKLNALNLNLTPELIGHLKRITTVLLVEETNLKKREKKEILSNASKGGYLNVKSDNFVNLYYASVYKEKLYLYENPKNEEKAKIYINFENNPQIVFNNAANTVRIKNESNDLELYFENDTTYKSWKNTLSTQALKIEKRLLASRSTGDVLKSNQNAPAAVAVPEETNLNENIINLQLNFKFEDLMVTIREGKSYYKLSTQNLALQLQQRARKLTTHLELSNFSMVTFDGVSEEYMLTSFYEKSLASKMLRERYTQKQKQLIIVKFIQETSEDGKLAKNTANIMFGSLFIDMEPSKLSKLMTLIIGPKDSVDELVGPDLGSSISLSTIEEAQPELSTNILSIYENSKDKKNKIQEVPIDFELNLEIQAINVLCISSIRKIPIVDIIIKDSHMQVALRKGAMTFQGEFLDLIIFDLTNYPRTLTAPNFDAVVPCHIFGKLQESSKEPLVKVSFSSKDPQIFNIPESLEANTLDVEVSNVKATVMLQVLMRIINFITDQLLPALTGADGATQSMPDFELSLYNDGEERNSVGNPFTQTAELRNSVMDRSRTIPAGRETRLEKREKVPSYLQKRNAFIAIMKPFWSKMNVQVKNTQCILPINENANLTAFLELLTVTNFRSVNQSRLLMCDNTLHKFPLKGIWNDDYLIKISNLGVKIAETSKPDKMVTTPISLDLNIQMPLFEPEYDILYSALKISNHGNRHMQTSVHDKTHKTISLKRVYYDNALMVSTRLSQFITQIGNYEYLCLMGALDRSILFNDGKDDLYIKDFLQKQSEMKPTPMFIRVNIGNIALVTLDNKNNNAVTAKVFVHNFNFQMVSHPTGESAMNLSIQDLKGYHLLKYQEQYHEKGFIGDLWVSNVYTPKDTNNLQELFLASITSDTGEEVAEWNDHNPNFNMVMEATKELKTLNIVLKDLKVLMQTDVILQLAELTNGPASKPTGDSTSTTTANTTAQNNQQAQQVIPMQITVEITNNSFIIPSADHEFSLVTKGDIVVDLYMCQPPSSHVAIAHEIFEAALRYDLKEKEGDENTLKDQPPIKLSDYRKMNLSLKLLKFEIFLVEFLSLFRKDQDEVAKRPLLLPVTMTMDLDQYFILKQRLQDPSQSLKASVNKIKLATELVEFKFSAKDIELLLGIFNYQMLMLNSRSDTSNQPEKNLKPENKIADSQIQVSKLETADEMTFNYLSLNLLDFKVTLINDYKNLFAPTLIFKLKNFKVIADLEELIKAVVAFSCEAHYFNSDIFHWEPFLEKSTLRIEYSTTENEFGVKGKVVKLATREDTPFNINVSMAFLDKVKFLMEAWDTMKVKNQEEHDKAKSIKMESYLQSLHRTAIIESLKRHMEKSEFQHGTYISPIRITNHTGYTLQVQYYKKKVNIDTTGTPVLKSEKESLVTIADCESQPLNVEESLEEYDDKKGMVHSDFSYKFISFKMEHPDFNISRVTGVNIIPNYSNKIVLKGKQKNLQDYKVIYSSRTNKDLKEILITSSVMLINTLPVDLNITIFHPFKQQNYVISPDNEIYVPFDMINYLFEMKVGNKKMTFKNKFESYCLKNAGYFTVVGTDDRSYNFILKVFRDPKCYYLTKLVAVPAIMFMNHLPMEISIDLLNQKETRPISLTKEQSFATSDFDITTIVRASVSVPGFRSSEVFTIMENNKLVYPKILKIFDSLGREAVINIVRLRDGYSHFNFAVYCSVIIINETPFHLSYFANETRRHTKNPIGGLNVSNENIPGYDRRVGLLGAQKTFLEVELNSDPKYTSSNLSNIISTQGIGSGVFQLPVKSNEATPKDFFIELGYKTSLLSIDEKDFITSKVIHITPKTILYNQSKIQINFQVEGQSAKTLEPEEKAPVYVFPQAIRRDKLINFWVVVEGMRYSSMKPLDLNKAGTSMFLLIGQDRNSYRIFRVELMIQQDYAFITFMDRTGYNDLVLVNHTDYNLVFRQRGVEEKYDLKLKKGEEIEFAFPNPYGPKLIEVELHDSENRLRSPGSFQIKIHKLVKEHHQITSDGRVNIYSDLTLDNEKRRLELTPAPELSQLEGGKNKLGKAKSQQLSLTQRNESDFTNVEVQIKNFGVSIIAKYKNQTVEMFYVYLNNIRFIGILAEEQQEFQLIVNYINIDSNYSSDIQYPVLLTTSKSLEKIGASNFLNFHVIINPSKNENLYNLDVFELEIMPITITTEFSVVGASIALAKQLQAIFKPKSSSEYLTKYFKDEQTSVTASLINFTNYSEWQLINFKTSNTWIYCREFKLSLIKVILTFSMTNYAENTNKEFVEDINVDLLIQTIGVTFLNIDESPISITGLKLESIYESVDSFTNIIAMHIKDQQNRNFARLVGSLDIIGNPVSLFSNISNGVVEFFEKPVTGFIKGPFEGFVGIAQGSGSLIKNTAAGTFNTISKVSSSLASGLAALSMDAQYLKQRNLDRARKPQNLFEGVGQGFLSIGKGIISGVTGVISQPITEIKKSGATGIFKGMIKGFGGLVMKPVSGVFQATSQTAEGLKKTVTFFDDKANEKKMRTPRVFYSTVQYFKAYNANDSNVMKALKALANKKFENDTFVEAVLVKDEQSNNKGHLIVLTHEHFLIIREDFTAIEMNTEIKDIAKLKYVDSNHLRIEYFFEGTRKDLTISSKQSNVYKIINALNYCKYINYANLHK